MIRILQTGTGRRSMDARAFVILAAGPVRHPHPEGAPWMAP